MNGICVYHQKGYCRNGYLCDFEHTKHGKTIPKADIVKEKVAFQSLSFINNNNNNKNGGKNKNKLSFRFGTLNVLSTGYLDPRNYAHCPEMYLEDGERMEKISSFIVKQQLTIVVFQEMQINCFDLMKSSLINKSGVDWECCYLERGGEKSDGCGMFWKKSEFKLIELHKLNLDDTFVGDESKFRYSVALAAVLQPVNGNDDDDDVVKQPILFATTHIYWKPKDVYIKIKNVEYLLKQLSKISTSHANIPLILGGDFNASSESGIYDLITNGIVSLSELKPGMGDDREFNHSKRNSNNNNNSITLPNETLSHQLQLQSVYKLTEGKDPQYTTYARSHQGCVDYIFASKSIIQSLNSTLSLPKRNELPFALPCVYWGSDHLLLAAEFLHT